MTLTSLHAEVISMGQAVTGLGPIPELLGIDREMLHVAGFDAELGSTLAIPTATRPLGVAVGSGDPGLLDVLGLLETLTLVGDEESLLPGATRGRSLAAATALARDPANSPHDHLSASRLADLASELVARAAWVWRCSASRSCSGSDAAGSWASTQVLAVWLVLFVVWFVLGIPLGPDRPVQL